MCAPAWSALWGRPEITTDGIAKGPVKRTASCLVFSFVIFPSGRQVQLRRTDEIAPRPIFVQIRPKTWWAWQSLAGVGRTWANTAQLAAGNPTLQVSTALGGRIFSRIADGRGVRSPMFYRIAEEGGRQEGRQKRAGQQRGLVRRQCFDKPLDDPGPVLELIPVSLLEKMQLTYLTPVPVGTHTHTHTHELPPILWVISHPSPPGKSGR